MAWNRNLLDSVVNGLHSLAEEGRFAPGAWIRHNEPGEGVVGCGWGLVGWLVACAIAGPLYAQIMLPVGCRQNAVNEVLKLAGLTRSDLRCMTQWDVIGHFDAELYEAYENRENDPERYLNKSLELADFFCQVLRRVPVAEMAIIESNKRLLPWDDIPVLTDEVEPEFVDETEPVARAA